VDRNRAPARRVPAATDGTGQVDGNIYRPPPLDVDGYLDCVQRCRAEFAGQLPIVAGVELGDPHWHPEEAAALDAAGFELIVGSVHSLRHRAGLAASGWLALDATLLTWWREEGGQAVSFGSDAHDPFTIGHQFAAAVDFAQAAGFGPGRSGRGL
jgi:histidinol phosphatase-like PHP family hydrolase